MSLKEKLRADIKRLKSTGGSKFLIVLLLSKKNFRIVLSYRILNHYHKNKIISILLLPLAVYYRLMTNKYCIDLTVNTNIGAGFKLNHSYGIVVNQRTIIGDNVYIAHNVTIGSAGTNKFPKIGNNVTIFPGSIIIGDVTIGDNVTIGAGSLVVKDIPSDTVVGGHPGKVLKTLSNIDINS
jgi:serine acetyltransferase